MAVAIKKAVRVEEVTQLQDDRSESLFGDSQVKIHNDNQKNFFKTGNTSPISGVVSVMSESLTPVTLTNPDDDISIDYEARNTVAKMPEGWPKLAKLQDMHSWDYTIIEPSVVKATTHLQLLQSILEDWFTSYESRQQSRLSSKAKSRKPASPGRSHIQFQRDSVTPSSTELSVQGIGARDPNVRHAVVREPTPEEPPYLGADDVFDEVLLLLAKMETSRKDHLEALWKERERSQMLKTKIDNLSQIRLIELPAAVQKEHEACAMDINELNWHVSYRTRIEERNQRKSELAETLNNRLKEEIEFVSGFIPLVKEKLDLEKDAMERIEVAQADADEELDTTMQRFRNVDAKSTEAHIKAEQERKSIKQDLDTVLEDLRKIKKELDLSRKTYEHHVRNFAEYTQKYHDNKQEIQVLLIKDENTKAAEAMQFSKVRELETDIKRKLFEQKSLEEFNLSVMMQIDVNAEAFGKVENEIRGRIAEQEEILRKLNRQNNELKMDNDDLYKKITDCDQQKVADEKNLERMKKEHDKTEIQISVTKEDLANILVINSAIRSQLNSDEERCLQAEEQLRAASEGLKRQIKEEIQARLMMSARINSDSTELKDSQVDFQAKRDVLDKKAAEIKAALASVLKKVEKLRKFHIEKTKMVADMREELKNLAAAKDDLQKFCERKIADLTPPHKRLERNPNVYSIVWENLQAETKKLEHMNWKTEIMNKSIKEMDESAAMMEKATDKTNNAIKILESDLNELNIQLEAGQKILDRLTNDMTQAMSRREALEKIHNDHMLARQNAYKDLEKNLEENKALNKSLAARYRTLQNSHVELKKKMLNEFENKIRFESAVKDLKQLQALQMRMRAAMKQYFKYRGLYNEAELQSLEEQSHTNGVKVGNLQDQMDGALNKITYFLTNQLDGDKIRQIAQQKVKDDERREMGLPVLPPIKVTSSAQASLPVS